MRESKYNSLKEFRIADPNAYQAICRTGILNDICKLFGWAYMKKLVNPHNYWTKERCIEEARKYKTKSKWAINSSGSYRAAIENGWLEECCKHMISVHKPNGYWTKERCIEEARKYKTRTAWAKAGGNSYQVAKNNGWLEECCKHMTYIQLPNGYWTKERCIEEARKYKTRGEWKEKGGSSYRVAIKNGWMDECCKLMQSGFKLRYQHN